MQDHIENGEGQVRQYTYRKIAKGSASRGEYLSFAKNRSDGKPCSIIALANEMNQVKGRVTIVADNHVTQRYVPPHPASRFSRTTRYRFGNVGFSFRCIFGEPQAESLR